MNNIQFDINSFLLGIIGGMAFVALVVIVTDLSDQPPQTQREAVSLGKAEWAVTTNSIGIPKIEFRWK
jgi:hypothetical protein